MIPANHVEACFDLLGGPKVMRIDHKGGHQVVRQYPEVFARYVCMCFCGVCVFWGFGGG